MTRPPFNFFTQGNEPSGHSTDGFFLCLRNRVLMEINAASEIKASVRWCVNTGLKNDFRYCPAFKLGEVYSFLCNQFFHPFRKLLKRHRAFRLLLATDAYVHRPGLGLFFTDYQQEWHFLHRMLANFG